MLESVLECPLFKKKMSLDSSGTCVFLLCVTAQNFSNYVLLLTYFWVFF
jgi:hypothetical protein